MYSVPDHQFTGCMEQDFNKTLNILYNQELENNVTKLYAKLDKKDKKQLEVEAKLKGITVAELLKQRSTIVETDFVGDKSGDKSNGSIQLIQGNIQFEQY
jgi:hypothetical protein